MVTVGNAGNAPDTAVMTSDGTTGYGSVPYVYRIGEYDVTVGQYCQFLNAVAKTDPYGLYNGDMAPDTGSVYQMPTSALSRAAVPATIVTRSAAADPQAANCPIFDLSWGDAARFCNWLQNGQPTYSGGNLGEVAGSTETGAYTLNGDMTTPAGESRNPGLDTSSHGKRVVQGGILQGWRHERGLLGVSHAEQYGAKQCAVSDRNEQCRTSTMRMTSRDGERRLHRSDELFDAGGGVRGVAGAVRHVRHGRRRTAMERVGRRRRPRRVLGRLRLRRHGFLRPVRFHLARSRTPGSVSASPPPPAPSRAMPTATAKWISTT